MLCEKCKCKEDCGWYGSYKRIEMEIYTGIGTDNTLGRADWNNTKQQFRGVWVFWIKKDKSIGGFMTRKEKIIKEINENFEDMKKALVDNETSFLSILFRDYTDEIIRIIEEELSE